MNLRTNSFQKRWLHTSSRGIAEFLIVVGVFALGDPTAVSLVIGGIISAAGEFIRIVTAGYGYKVGELTLRGPYRFVRHPYFLGNALLYFGLCVAARNPWVMGFAILAMSVTYRRELKRDEGRWAQHLGPRFADYRARVPAFLPQLWPLAPERTDKRGFSLESAIFTGRHREFDALLGLAIAFGLLYLCYRIVQKDLFQLGVLAAVGLYLIGRIIYYGFAKRPS